MPRFQRTLTAAFAAAALAGSFAISANAQTAPVPSTAAPAAHATSQHGPRATHGQTHDVAKRHAQRNEHLKTILQLQPNQQAAWDQYVKATTHEPRAKHEGQRPDLRKLSTPQRLDLAQKMRQERMAKAEQREQATRTFYSSLSASQQKAFDTVTAHRHGQPGMHKAGFGKRMEGAHGPHHGHGRAGHPAAPVAPAA